MIPSNLVAITSNRRQRALTRDVVKRYALMRIAAHKVNLGRQPRAVLMIGGCVCVGLSWKRVNFREKNIKIE